MILDNSAEKYNRWYHSQYGSWVGQLEFSLLCQLLQPIKQPVKDDSLIVFCIYKKQIQAVIKVQDGIH